MLEELRINRMNINMKFALGYVDNKNARKVLKIRKREE